MRKVLLLVCVAAFTLLIVAGCSGGNSGIQSSLHPGTSLRVAANTLMSPTTGVKGIVSLSKLDAGANIAVYDFATGQLLTQGVIGTDGSGSVNVTAGLSVVVVVSGASAGKAYRLSAIIASVPTADTSLIIDPASTLAAELLGQRDFQRSGIDQSTVDTATNLTGEWLSEHSGCDLSLGGGLLTAGSSYADANSVDATKLSPVIAQLTPIVNSNLVKARKAIQQIKDIGGPITTMTTTEKSSVEKITTKIVNAFSTDGMTAIETKYSQLSSRLNRLIMPGIQGDWAYKENGVEMGYRSIFDLVIGKGYLATEMSDGFGNTWIEITPKASLDVRRQITVKLPGKFEMLTITATQSGSQWTITQTSTRDSRMKYSCTMPYDIVLGADPKVTTSVTIQDSMVTPAINYTGTLKATGPDKQHYTHMEFNGALTAKEISAKGVFAVDFPPVLPVGANSDATTYEFPTRVSLTNGSWQWMMNGETLAVAGSGAITAQPFLIGGQLVDRPVSFTLTNGSASIKKGSETIALSGNVSFNCTFEDSGINIVGIVPTSLSITNFNLTFQDGAKKITATGGLTVTAQEITVNGATEVVPTYAKLNGTYTNSDTRQGLTGTIEATWLNPQNTDQLDQAQGSLVISGNITKGTAKAYQADFRFDSDGAGNITATFNKLGFVANNSPINYSGTGAMTIVTTDGDTAVTSWNVSLINQDRVVIALSGNRGIYNGSVKIGDEQEATIAKDPITGFMKFLFTDNTIIEIPL